MRTTLDIDDDVLQAAKELAAVHKRSAGQILSDLARVALRHGMPARPADYDLARGEGERAMRGFGEAPQAMLGDPPVADDAEWQTLPSRGGLVTQLQVDRIAEEVDQEELTRALAARR